MDKVTISPYLFRSLDIRGADPEYVKSQNITPGSLKEKSAHGCPLGVDQAYVIGRSIAEQFRPQKIVVGQDTRLSSPELAEALIKGLTDQGVNVDSIGLVTTEAFYFAIGNYKYEMGVMVTGSHTIKYLNGFKISKFDNGRVFPIAQGIGMEELKETALNQVFSEPTNKGDVREINILDDFKNHILSLFDYKNFKKQKVVFDAANSVGGKTAEGVIDALPIEAVKINFDLDGNFPNHEPDPMIPENIKQLVSKMDSEKADFGVAWDGDADRMTLVTPDGEILTGSFISPMLLPWVAEKHPNSNVIVSIVMSWASSRAAEKLGMKVVYSRVGNSFIKIAMKDNAAVFGCEEADHFMFEESFWAESSTIPFMIVLDRIAKSGKTFSDLLSEAKGNLLISGDVNMEVKDATKVLQAVEEVYKNEGGQINKMDGLTISFDDWHFTLRPSLNDPVVRLNLEAQSQTKLESEIKKIKEIVDKAKND
jgi:phosphomannomutase